VRCDLFEEFCICLLKDKPFADHALPISRLHVPDSGLTMTVTAQLIASMSDLFSVSILQTFKVVHCGGWRETDEMERTVPTRAYRRLSFCSWRKCKLGTVEPREKYEVITA
jgi:hypothetical protein